MRLLGIGSVTFQLSDSPEIKTNGHSERPVHASHQGGGLVCRWGKNSPVLSSRVRSTAHGRTPSAQGSPSTSVWTGLLNVSGCLTGEDKHMLSGGGSLTYGMAGNGVLGGEELSVAAGLGAQGSDWEAVRKSLQRPRLDSGFTYKQLEVMKCT